MYVRYEEPRIDLISVSAAGPVRAVRVVPLPAPCVVPFGVDAMPNAVASRSSITVRSLPP